MSSRGTLPLPPPPVFVEPNWSYDDARSYDPFAAACRRRQAALEATEHALAVRAKDAADVLWSFDPLIRAARRGALPLFPEPGEPFPVHPGATCRNLNNAVLAMAGEIHAALDRLELPLWDAIVRARFETLARIDDYVREERG